MAATTKICTLIFFLRYLTIYFSLAKANFRHSQSKISTFLVFRFSEFDIVNVPQYSNSRIRGLEFSRVETFRRFDNSQFCPCSYLSFNIKLCVLNFYIQF